MDPITIIILAFLAVSLSVAAFRAADTLRKHDEANKPDPRREVVHYTGPTYSRHGGER